MLKALNLHKLYGTEHVLDDVGLEMREGTIRSLIGPNGAGKTTTFNLLAGVELPEEGHVFLHQKQITYDSIHQRARAGLSYLPQQPSLFRGLSVKENILVVLQQINTDADKPPEEVLSRLGIQSLARKRASELSAGQRRKAEIARSLATTPQFLLLDEPFSGLDPLSVEELKNIAVSLRSEDQLGLGLTDHKIRDTLAISDYNYLLHDGKVIVEGNSEEILNDKQAREIYLGSEFRT